MKTITLREFREFLASQPEEWDDLEIQYIDFSWTTKDSVRMIKNENDMLIVIE